VESGFHGCETVERGGPKAGQSGLFLHVLVFWRLFLASCRREGHKTAVFGVFSCFPARERDKGRRTKRKENMVGLRKIQRFKWDLNRKWDNYYKLHSLSFCIFCCFSTAVTHYHLLFVVLHLFSYLSL